MARNRWSTCLCFSVTEPPRVVRRRERFEDRAVESVFIRRWRSLKEQHRERPHDRRPDSLRLRAAAGTGADDHTVFPLLVSPTISRLGMRCTRGYWEEIRRGYPF